MTIAKMIRTTLAAALFLVSFAPLVDAAQECVLTRVTQSPSTQTFCVTSCAGNRTYYINNGCGDNPLFVPGFMCACITLNTCPNGQIGGSSRDGVTNETILCEPLCNEF